MIRANSEDPLRQVTFEDDSASRLKIGKQRVGRPKQNWTRYTKEAIWKDILNKFDKYKEKDEQDALIYEAAVQRKL